MSSLLDDFKLSRSTEYRKLEQECPPISQQLLGHLDKMFARKTILPTSPTIGNELIYQAGVEKVLDYLRRQNGRQEDRIRADRIKDN